MARWFLAAALSTLVSAGLMHAATPSSLNPLEPLVRILATSSDIDLQRDILRGMVEALQGRRNVAAPPGWSAVHRKLAASRDPEVRNKVLVLSVLFGDPRALATLRKRVADPNANLAARQGALQTLLEKQDADLLPLLRQLLADPKMRGPALRGLAAFQDPGIPGLILRYYPTLTEPEKADGISTLASRPQFARALLEAMEKGRIPRRDLSPFTARQLLAFQDRDLTSRLNKVWGALRPPARDKVAQLARYQALVTPQALKAADRSQGRLVFTRTCANCHALFDAGGKIGPDLTGSQRGNPEYILTKLVDPNAVVARDYQVTLVTTTNGRLITGLVKEETAKTLTLQTEKEVVRLPKSEIEERKRLEVSMMPEGQLAQLADAEIRDLIAYLAAAAQVPLPPQEKQPKEKHTAPP